MNTRECEIIQNFDLPNLNSWLLAWNWLAAAAVEQKAETGKYTPDWTQPKSNI